MGNRHQKRAEASARRKHNAALAKVVSKAKLESVPKPPDAKPMECDIAGCSAEWQFSTMATLNARRRVVARRCTEHRLG